MSFTRSPRAPVCLIAALLAFTSASTVQAQDDAAPRSLGLGLAFVPEYEGSTRLRPFPLVQANARFAGVGIDLEGSSLSMDLLPAASGSNLGLEFGPFANLRLDRTGKLNNAQLAMLGHRSAALEVGAYVALRKTGIITSPYDQITLRLSAAGDLAGAHGSYVITPTISYMTPLSARSFVNADLTGEIVGAGYGRYYFDVSQQESSMSGLAAYNGAGQSGGLKNLAVKITPGFALSGDLRHGWIVYASLGYSRILDRYGRSPLVEAVGSHSQWSTLLGISYSF